MEIRRTLVKHSASPGTKFWIVNVPGIISLHYLEARAFIKSYSHAQVIEIILGDVEQLLCIFCCVRHQHEIIGEHQTRN